uniref:PrcB C-terminal domain-containing protein n=1 Tax=Trieres chinensis TaxID=1514140 RepID=A0A7S1ZXI1_TRICV|mmetsp:Transcript_34719/g.70908  ORF Transcript_34719/g.70908 Transcript_34719/m.70908 type:complete len:251 (+) Transcript_34719:78-830(+)
MATALAPVAPPAASTRPLLPPLLLLLITGLASSSASLTFETVAKGHSCGIYKPLTSVVRAPSDFVSLWSDHGSDRYPPPLAPVDAIDFEREMVVAVYRGSMSSGGYGVEVTGVEEREDGTLVVTVVETDPPPGATTSAALTQPYHVIKTARSDKDVRFVAVKEDGRAKPDAAAAPAAPFPAFLLSFEKGSDGEAVASRIRAMNPPVSGVRLLGRRIAVVTFDSTKIDQGGAASLLEGIEGVGSVEVDQQF